MCYRRTRFLIMLALMGTLSIFADFSIPTGAFALDISSPAFIAGGQIPPQYSCSGANQSPELKWSGAPPGTQSFVLIMDDPDAPAGTFVHWVVFNIPAQSGGIPVGAPTSPRLTDGSIQGTNSANAIGYKGPCPPPGGPHHYHFKLFAIDSMLDLTSAADSARVQSSMSGHTRGNAELVGTFSR